MCSKTEILRTLKMGIGILHHLIGNTVSEKVRGKKEKLFTQF